MHGNVRRLSCLLSEAHGSPGSERLSKAMSEVSDERGG
jgi:hypothetical protein